MSEANNGRNWEQVQDDIEFAQNEMEADVAAIEDPTERKQAGNDLLATQNDLHAEQAVLIAQNTDRLKEEAALAKDKKMGEIAAHEAVKQAEFERAQDAFKSVDEGIASAYGDKAQR